MKKEEQSGLILGSTDKSANHEWDNLDSLMVIERLDVGPCRLEKNRIKAPYNILYKGNTYSNELIYKFEDSVLNPEDPVSRNLADMITAQAAINYGLFCDEILFHGSFDKFDRQFIMEMAENTAREIYVNRFLKPNPFLVKEFQSLPVNKKKKYLNAKINFSGGFFKGIVEKREINGKAASSYSVLSSGGKDSLLSFALLNSLGYKTTPVFINESGRHWFTALNAYNYFKAHIPDTHRVWTNADRIFNWFLQFFPFIRQDHSNIRSDEYPVRLWTVAVFLFGALPILINKGIGNLVIGNEHDTTRKRNFKGITNYDGLFDQSRYFDDALSRYFENKGFGIRQFSILRPLSELLIEDILAKRYPELQENQVSCHAAHKQDQKVLPCGRCEKCRRIIGMLSAIGADPRRCGYTEEQIEYCLKAMVEKGTKQERKETAHLAYLLSRKKIIDQPYIAGIKGEHVKDVMSLRFDPERSPVECIPKSLRRPLYGLYLEYADGAIIRRGREWIVLDLLKSPELDIPYGFELSVEVPAYRNKGPKGKWDAGASFLLGDLTWPEAKDRIKEVDLALLPVGAIEQHGPHLPLDTDAYDANYLAIKVAEACEAPKPLILPLIPYGVSYHHEDFCGTISINPSTLSQMVYDIGMSAVKHGIKKLVIINGHGGNIPALHFAAQMIDRDARIFTCVDSGESSDTDIYSIAETPNDVHAGEIETSTTMVSRPHMVRKDKIKKFIPRFSSRYLDFTSKRSVGWYAHTSKISSSGILGDPTKASLEKGQRMWDLMIKNLVEFVEGLKNLTLEEIYQKRY